MLYDLIDPDRGPRRESLSARRRASRPLSVLSDAASRDALAVPARDRGVEWAHGGLDAALEVARGYPYFLQSVDREARLGQRLGAETGATVADIASAMGKSRASDISVARNELIKKGLVYAPERGLLAFTVPGMHDFVDRQP